MVQRKRLSGCKSTPKRRGSHSLGYKPCIRNKGPEIHRIRYLFHACEQERPKSLTWCYNQLSTEQILFDQNQQDQAQHELRVRTIIMRVGPKSRRLNNSNANNLGFGVRDSSVTISHSCFLRVFGQTKAKEGLAICLKSSCRQRCLAMFCVNS